MTDPRCSPMTIDTVNGQNRSPEAVLRDVLANRGYQVNAGDLRELALLAGIEIRFKSATPAPGDVGEIVRRLRATGGKGQGGPLKAQAADALERLSERLARYEQ